MKLDLNMIPRLSVMVLGAWAFTGCGSVQMQGDNRSARSSNASGADNSAQSNNDSESYSYLADAAESAAIEVGEASVDESVHSNLHNAKLNEMVSRIIVDVDTDGSGLLSLEEFLSGPEKMAAKQKDSRFAQLSVDAKAKMTSKLTEEFSANAGDDSQLSSDELSALLVAQAPRIAGFRKKGHGHGRGLGREFGRRDAQGERPPLASPEELFSKCDKNADGILDKAEFAEFMKLHAPRHREVAERI